MFKQYCLSVHHMFLKPVNYSRGFRSIEIREGLISQNTPFILEGFYPPILEGGKFELDALQS